MTEIVVRATITPMTNVNVSLPEPMKAWLEDQVEQGAYGTVSEVVRSLIRDAQRLRAEHDLEKLLLEGIKSGEPLDGEVVLKRLRKKNAARQRRSR